MSGVGIMNKEEISTYLEQTQEPTCEFPRHHLGMWGHSGKGEVLLQTLHTCEYRKPKLYLLCKSGWEYLLARKIAQCGDCGWKGPVDECLELIAYL